MIYLYGMIPTEQADSHFEADWPGIDGRHRIETIRRGAITALVCEVDPEEFSEEALKRAMHDLEWLKAKAIHHHETLLRLHARYTLIPLKLCTLFQEPSSLVRKLDAESDKMAAIFGRLTRKEEWNLKIYCRDDVLAEYVTNGRPELKTRREEMERLSPGRQFFARKQWEQALNTALQEEKERRCREVHQQLDEFSDQSVVKQNWHPDGVDQRKKMSWNAVYSIDRDNSPAFITTLTQLSQSYAPYGFSFESIGPWPNYHFANLS